MECLVAKQAYQKVTILNDKEVRAISTPKTDEHADPIDRRSIPASAQESLWQTPDGADVRRIDWPGCGDARRGSILFLPGRGDFYEKYLETLEEWHRKGWRVTACDWRGQAGSGRLGNDATTGHIDDFDIWISDLASFWSDWVKTTPAPHVLVSHSMGGQIVMRALLEKKLLPDAVIFSAPMLGINGPPLPMAALHAAARAMTIIGDARRPAWKWSEKPGEMPADRRNLLTHDAERYADELWWREHRPELVMGPGSWGWVERAYASVRAIEAKGAMESVETPILILSTRTDELISHAAVLRAADRLPNAELLAFGKEAHHEILRETPPVRSKAMSAIDDFLDRVAPALP